MDEDNYEASGEFIAPTIYKSVRDIPEEIKTAVIADKQAGELSWREIVSKHNISFGKGEKQAATQIATWYHRTIAYNKKKGKKAKKAQTNDGTFIITVSGITINLLLPEGLSVPEAEITDNTINLKVD